MTALDTDDLAVITGPLRIEGCGNRPDLYPGEAVTVLTPADGDGDVFVRGHESGLDEYISFRSLTPLVDLHDIHDFVWEGDE